MSIRFPKHCKTKAQKSAHARVVARIRWDRVHADMPARETCIGYIEFGGELAAGFAMRLNLVAVDGKRKWEARSEGRFLQNISERGVLRLVRTLLRMPRS